MATFTRKAIMQTFLHILKNKPLDRITVKDICEQCEICLLYTSDAADE